MNEEKSLGVNVYFAKGRSSLEQFEVILVLAFTDTKHSLPSPWQCSREIASGMPLASLSI